MTTNESGVFRLNVLYQVLRARRRYPQQPIHGIRRHRCRQVLDATRQPTVIYSHAHVVLASVANEERATSELNGDALPEHTIMTI
jgi:hypothetical protein